MTGDCGMAEHKEGRMWLLMDLPHNATSYEYDDGKRGNWAIDSLEANGLVFIATCAPAPRRVAPCRLMVAARNARDATNNTRFPLMRQ